MRKIITGVLTIAFIGVLSAGVWKACAADDDHNTSPTPPADAPPLGTHPAAPAAGAADESKGSGGGAAGGPKLGPATPPRDLVASTPKGELKNPYTDIASIAEEGHHRYLSAGCNGCHGGGGGGGMCPSLTNDTWVYGRDDDTLFRLITLGSVDLQKQGYTRVRTETIVGPMPPFGDIIKSSDDLWRIIAFIRSVNPSSLNPPPPPPPQ